MNARMLVATQQAARCRYARQGCTCYISPDLYGRKGNRKIRKSSRLAEKRQWRREQPWLEPPL